MSDGVGGRNGVVATGAGVVGASSSVVAGDADIDDALDSGLFMAVGAFVGGETSSAPAASGSVVTAAGAFFLAAGGIGAASSSAKGRGDVSDAGTAAARTPSGVKCHSPASTTLWGLPVSTA